jgi:hypothetical protein
MNAFHFLDQDQKITLNPLLKRDKIQPHLSYDLRRYPEAFASQFYLPEHGSLPNLARYLACEPPIAFMRLYHDRLPWDINVCASNPHIGVTVIDVLTAMYTNLMRGIRDVDYYNRDMDAQARDKIALAWRARCGYDEMEAARGLRRVDFLGRQLIFQGLEKGKQGAWAIRTTGIE